MAHMLDVNPAQRLTDRQCARLIGMMLGCLCTMANTSDVLRALQWWTERPELLDVLRDEAPLDAADAQRGRADSPTRGKDREPG